MNNKTTIIYISVPISGRDIEDVKTDIEFAENHIRDLADFFGSSIKTISPFDMEGWREGESWEWYMARCLKMINECDCIYVCKGWLDSRGCKLEVEYAGHIGMPILFE